MEQIRAGGQALPKGGCHCSSRVAALLRVLARAEGVSVSFGDEVSHHGLGWMHVRIILKTRRCKSDAYKDVVENCIH